MQGHHYWQNFVDDSSRFWVVAFLHHKSDALTAFKRYKAYAEKTLGKPIMVSRDDKGGELISEEYCDYTADHGIRRQHTGTGEPHQIRSSKSLPQRNFAAKTDHNSVF